MAKHDSPETTAENLPRRLWETYESMKSWRRVGSIIGTSGAMARYIALGLRKPSPEVVARFEAYRRGVPYRTAEAPVCLTCGRVHALHDCRGKLADAGGQIVVRRPPSRGQEPAGDYRPRIPRRYADHFRRLIRAELERLERT